MSKRPCGKTSPPATTLLSLTAKNATSSATFRIFSSRPKDAARRFSVLSGGEKNRLMLAKLFTKPANVLVLDEPTNDLDAETLELLEELIFEYPGTLLLVSHDRAFLNNVVTSTIVFEGNGQVVEYAGGYDDWLSQRPQRAAERLPEKNDRKKVRPKPKAPPITKAGVYATAGNAGSAPKDRSP